MNDLREKLIFDTIKTLSDYLTFNDEDLPKSLLRAEKCFERALQDEDQQSSGSSKANQEEEFF
jgi:hypothetical protein